MRYNPKFVEINSISKIIIVSEGFQTLYVPTQYHSNTYQILTNDNLIKFPCTVDSVNIQCQKYPIPENRGSSDIYFLKFKIQSNNVDLSLVNDEIMIYKNNSLIEISPMANLKTLDLNLTLIFDLNTLQRNLTIGSTIYCRDNSSDIYWSGTVISRTKVKCFISFVHHNKTSLNLDVILKVPTISVNDILLSTNFKTLYYLEPRDIEFSLKNQTKFEYTSTYLPVNITINSFIPKSIQKNIFCKISDSNIEHITYFIKSDGDLHFIMCNFTTEIDGRQNISIWYKDSYHQFKLSTNELELVFATPKSIYLFSPPAVKQNRTTPFSVYTLFPTQIDYGNNSFFCEYGYNNTGTFSKSSLVSVGVFKCDIILLTEGKAFMKIWMLTKQILKVITSNSELFNVVNSNFFEPSYATPKGGDKLHINDFSDGFDSVKFVNPLFSSKYKFDCHINGTKLTCTTPAILDDDFPVYSTQDLQFSNNQSISTRFILFEKRNIKSFYPKVISSTEGGFLMNISLYNETTLFEGKLFIVLSKFTAQDARYDLGGVKNLMEFNQNMKSLPSGVYPMELFYFNPFSFEIRSMFPISQIVNLTFTGISSIQLNTDEDMFYINKNESISIKFDAIEKLHLNEIQKDSIRCKMGNQILETKKNGYNDFICYLSSTTAKEQTLSMIYQNQDAYNQQILLSSNSIRITFVEKGRIQSILPFASLKSSQSVALNLSHSFQYDSIFKCKYGDQYTIATVNGSIFECLFDRISSTHYELNVTLAIKSKHKGTELLFSENHLPFYYLSKILSN